MNLIRRNQRPVRRHDLLSVMDELFDSLPTQTFFSNLPENFRSLDREFSPTLELKETENSYLVDVEVAGIKKEDIELNFENNALYIKGEKRAETEKTEEEKTHYSERFYGSFTRKIPFTEEVDPAKIEARYIDGVLKIKLVKKPTDTPSSRSISIQ